MRKCAAPSARSREGSPISSGASFAHYAFNGRLTYAGSGGNRQVTTADALDIEADDTLLRLALEGQSAARRELALRLTPVVQRRVCRPLAVQARRYVNSLQRTDVLDLTQQVLLLLFERDCQILRKWDPARGMSLMGFVGLVAEREARTVLRSGRRSAWAERPSSEEIAEFIDERPPVETEVCSRDELEKIWHRLEEELSPKALLLFRALLIDQVPIQELSQRYDLTPNALYTFRSRLRRQVHEIRQRLTDSLPDSGEAAQSCAMRTSSASRSAGFDEHESAGADDERT
jgi:hypothetical protein